MAIKTYNDLKTAIASWLDRSDLTALIPDFIELSEDQINRELRIMPMETNVVIPIVGTSYPLPDGFLEMRNIYLDGNPRIKLRFLSPESQVINFRWTNDAASQSYTIVNSSIVIAPPTDTTNSLSNAANIIVDYYKAFDNLSTLNPSNWLTENAFDLLLFSALSEANSYLLNAAGYEAWQIRYQNSLERLNTTHQNARFSGAAIEVRSPYSGI